jgi:hypothetical protein
MTRSSVLASAWNLMNDGDEIISLRQSFPMVPTVSKVHRLLKFGCLQFIPGRQGYFPKNNPKANGYGK